MKQNFKHPSFTDINIEYQKSIDNIGFCNCINYNCYIVQGLNALELINTLSRCYISSSQTSGYTIFEKTNKFIGEVLFFKASNNTYLIYSTYPNIFKELLIMAKSFSLTVVQNTKNLYSLYTFHGLKANSFFDNIYTKSLFCLNHQGYLYYHLIALKKDEKQVINYFKQLNFIPISVETKRLFLYNNKVITNFLNFSIFHRKDLINIKYPTSLNQTKFSLEKFECLSHELIDKNTKIFGQNRHVCGLVYNYFKLPNADNPFLLGITNQIQCDLLLIKKNNNNILIRKS